jgi:carbamoyl-phosphate synthase small subunit
MNAVLALKDGTVIHGTGFGAKTELLGELVFNTSMMGYQEALTDPSYGGQILLLTYPLVGNYGVSKNDFESSKIQPSGFVVRELSRDYDHRTADKNADNFLKEHNIPGICDVDTRFLVRHIRDKGVMPAILATSDTDIDIKKLLTKMNEFDYSSIDFVSRASTPSIKLFGKGNKKKIAMVDYGVKNSIITQLVERDCEVHLLPYHSSAGDINLIEPDGVLLSNGPGDPAILTHAHKTIQSIGGKYPIMGICLGHQLLAHAFGGNTYKLKFGHRGSNHAVMDIKTKRTYITTQNHGFAVGNLPKDFELTQVNINDRSIEGMKSDGKNIFSVQYHPEACPGPHDTRFLFDEFMKMI